jgi:hypothetical protein
MSFRFYRKMREIHFRLVLRWLVDSHKTLFVEISTPIFISGYPFMSVLLSCMHALGVRGKGNRSTIVEAMVGVPKKPYLWQSESDLVMGKMFLGKGFRDISMLLQIVGSQSLSGANSLESVCAVLGSHWLQLSLRRDEGSKDIRNMKT